MRAQFRNGYVGRESQLSGQLKAQSLVGYAHRRRSGVR